MKQVSVKENSEIEAIVEFSRNNPWKPQYPSNLVRRFLTELISNTNLIFDIHDDKGRVASAVLLDKVNNPANDACLEILGLRKDGDSHVVVPKFLTLAVAKVPKYRSGFQIGLPAESDLKIALNHFGLEEYYDTYEMVADIGEISDSPMEIIDADEKSRDEVYDVLCKSLEQNPDTSIPESKTWKINFLKNPGSYFYIWKSEEKILGFANLVEEDDSAEIRTIGVLPQSRGLGIGNHLLHHCMNRASKTGKNNCHLTVAVQNEKALALYLRAGFKTVEKFNCYRKSV